jgi:hypothetical protein
MVRPPGKLGTGGILGINIKGEKGGTILVIDYYLPPFVL